MARTILLLVVLAYAALQPNPGREHPPIFQDSSPIHSQVSLPRLVRHPDDRTWIIRKAPEHSLRMTRMKFENSCAKAFTVARKAAFVLQPSLDFRLVYTQSTQQLPSPLARIRKLVGSSGSSPSTS